MSASSYALSKSKSTKQRHPGRAIGVFLIVAVITVVAMAAIPNGAPVIGIVGLVIGVSSAREAWKPSENKGEVPEEVLKVLQAAERVAWSVPMSFSHDNGGKSWKTSRLYFTNRRLLWNVRKKGMFRKRVTYDDMPYGAIHSTDRSPMPGSKHGGMLVVNTAAGHRMFGFDNEEKLQETDRVFRQLLLRQGQLMQSM